MRTIWSGTISFGLVSVPVGLAKAQDRQGVSFRQIHKGCGERINQPKMCPTHGVLTLNEVARGYEAADGTIYEVPDGELEATRPDASKVIEVKGFVKSETIDPLFRDRTYFLMPAKEKAGREGYALLVQAMKKTGRAALGSFVLWNRENLCSIRSDGERLMMDLLFYQEDIRDSAPVDSLVQDVKVSKEAVELATTIIESEAIDFDHGTYFSVYAEKLRDMLEDLAAGKPAKKPKAVPKPKPDADLLAALKASVAANSTEKKKPTTRRKTAAGGRSK